MKPLHLFATALCCLSSAFAQSPYPRHGNHGQHPQSLPVTASHTGTHTPYAGMQNRAFKALSDQQLADVKAGRGMTLALSAELNGYPGPSHTLELSDALKLTPQQKVQTQQLLDDMKQQAVAAGNEFLAAEESLDMLFKTQSATPTNLGEAVKRSAEAQARLRETHLQYHLSMLKVLTTEQVVAYNKLRGY